MPQFSRQVRLVGRQRVTVNKSWCMYGSHAPTTMCDYCVPSACLRALLRLLSLPGEGALIRLYNNNKRDTTKET